MPKKEPTMLPNQVQNAEKRLRASYSRTGEQGPTPSALKARKPPAPVQVQRPGAGGNLPEINSHRAEFVEAFNAERKRMQRERDAVREGWKEQKQVSQAKLGQLKREVAESVNVVRQVGQELFSTYLERQNSWRRRDVRVSPPLSRTPSVAVTRAPSVANLAATGKKLSGHRR